jgi:hypothetical protein
MFDIFLSKVGSLTKSIFISIFIRVLSLNDIRSEWGFLVHEQRTTRFELDLRRIILRENHLRELFFEK